MSKLRECNVCINIYSQIYKRDSQFVQAQLVLAGRTVGEAWGL